MTASRARCCCDRRGRCTPSACGSRSTSPSSTRDLRVLRVRDDAAVARRAARVRGATRCSRPRPAPSRSWELGVGDALEIRDGELTCRSSSWRRRSATSVTCRPGPSPPSPRPTASACEDTRRTGRLLQLAGIARREGVPLVGSTTTPRRTGSAGVLDRVRRGESVVVVTDAGMPGIADPGERLVRAPRWPRVSRSRWCRARRPSCPRSSRPGLPTGRFVFEGFLPRQGGGRSARLAELAAERRTDRPLRGAAPPRPHPGRPGRRLRRAIGGWRSARELTKLHEEVRRGDAGRGWRRGRRRSNPPASCVVVVDGAPPPAARWSRRHRRRRPGRARRRAVAAGRRRPGGGRPRRPEAPGLRGRCRDRPQALNALLGRG